MPHSRRRLQDGSLLPSLVGQLQLTLSRQPVLLMWHTCRAVLAPAAVEVLGCCDPCSPKHNATIIEADLRGMIANRRFVLLTVSVAGYLACSDLGAAALHGCKFLDWISHRRHGFNQTSMACLHCLGTRFMFWSWPAVHSSRRETQQLLCPSFLSKELDFQDVCQDCTEREGRPCQASMNTR